MNNEMIHSFATFIASQEMIYENSAILLTLKIKEIPKNIIIDQLILFRKYGKNITFSIEDKSKDLDCWKSEVPQMSMKKNDKKIETIDTSILLEEYISVQCDFVGVTKLDNLTWQLGPENINHLVEKNEISSFMLSGGTTTTYSTE